MTDTDDLLKRALGGDIVAFQALFAEFQPALKSYLFRLVANRSDAQDLLHDTYLRAFEKIASFRGEASLKAWVFQIATNLAYTHLRRFKRWTPDAKAQAKELCLSNEAVYTEMVGVAKRGVDAVFDMREHIDACFTCMGKTLPIENQVALILKDMYDFSVSEICLILDKTEGVVKYLLQDARKTMMDIFDHRCSLINKMGVCHQCSELNGIFNPSQNQQEALMRLDLVKGSKKYDREKLYFIRSELVRAIDPLETAGASIQEALLKIDRMAMGEVEIPGSAQA